MSDPPYRPRPGDSGQEAERARAEVARLAAKGKQRIHRADEAAATQEAAAEHAQDEQGERNVRLALGAYCGSPLRTAWFALAGSGLSTVVLVAVFGGNREVSGALACLVAGWIAFVVGLVIAFGRRWSATRARLAAEKMWTASLPFRVSGYFELLAAEPTIACRLTLDLAWEPGHAPSVETVQGVLGLWDANVHVETHGDGGLRARGGPFVCGLYKANSTVNDFGKVVPNRQIVARVHRLVIEALLPLHRSSAIERVTLAREQVAADGPWVRFPKA